MSGCLRASSRSLRFILSLRLYSSFITSRYGPDKDLRQSNQHKYGFRESGISVKDTPPLELHQITSATRYGTLRGYNSNICFSTKLPILPDEFFDQCLTSGISFESVHECLLITFYHCVRLELRLTHSNVSLEGPKIICKFDHRGEL